MIKRLAPIDGAVEKGLTPSHPRGDLGLRKINYIFATTPNISVVYILVDNQSNHQSNIILGAKTAINQFNHRVLETAIKSIIKIVID
jgi:hypothetical protein